MENEHDKLINKAERSLNAGERLYHEGDHDFAASRIYYALFYLAEALLLEKGLSFSRHSAVIAGFYEHFVKTNIFPKEFHKLLHHAYNLRQDGDYQGDCVVEEAEVSDLIAKAKKFFLAVKAQITKSATKKLF
ncbi:MAG: hypothetical protein ACD_62C00461G0002 [uncultured bacterium]|nr:MAG: hypothetical protein ACD_62C00461G0002 [uncultured bacterium]HLD44137.1 HEPN domain-containing protein [bacterium]